MEKDFVKEKRDDDTFSRDSFLSGAENYPLSKSMVYHNQKGIEARWGWKVGNKIAGDLLERPRGQGFYQSEGDIVNAECWT